MASSFDRFGLSGEFLIVKNMKASDEDSRTAKNERTRLEYHAAGPSQCSDSLGVQEKQPMTAAASSVLFRRLNTRYSSQIWRACIARLGCHFGELVHGNSPLLGQTETRLVSSLSNVPVALTQPGVPASLSNFLLWTV